MVQYESGDLSPTLADLAEIERKEALEQGIEQGIGQGIEQGSELATKNVALKMLQEGLEVDFIAKLTELTVPEVEKLKRTLM